MDSNQLSVISERSSTVATRESLAHCPVAQRLNGKEGIPTAAVAVIASADRSIRTAADSVRYAGVSVRRFAKEFDERTLAALVLTHLTIVEDMANVARPMKPEALAQLAKNVARMLMEDDVTVNLADLQIVADRLVSGDAGQVYGGLNSQMVMKAFADFICEKANAFADWREEQAKEHSFGGFGTRSGGDTERIKNHEAMKMYIEQKSKEEK